MLVIVKSAPDTCDGKRGVALAQELAADLVFLQNGIYFAQKGRLQSYRGAAYVLSDDARLRGLGAGDLDPEIRAVDYAGLVDLMVTGGKVVGMF